MEKDKLEQWIENNRGKYFGILFGLALFLGFSFFYLLGNPNWVITGFAFGVCFGIFFIVVDLILH